MRQVDANGGVGGRLDWPAGVCDGDPRGAVAKNHAVLEQRHSGVNGSLDRFRFPATTLIVGAGKPWRKSRIGISSRLSGTGFGSGFGFGGVRLVFGAGVLGCVLFLAMSDFGRRAAVVQPLWPSVERFASTIGLGIDQVSVSGHHHTSERDVFDALKLTEQRSFLSFDSGGALSRLRELAWVKSASLVRVLPGRLDVVIFEREAFALWQRGGELLLIDASGRVLSVLDKRSAPNLPVVVGEGAGAEVAPLMRLVASSKFISSRLLSARRVSGRRWTLFLTGGVVLHLPAQGAASALALVRTHRKLRDLILRPGTELDLRVSGRVFVGAQGRGGATSVFLTTHGTRRSPRGPG